MDSQKQCCIHVDSGKHDSILFVSEKSYAKLKYCERKWRNLDGIERQKAEEFSKICKIFHFSKLFYHPRCYSQFTDITKISRAAKHNAKKRQAIPDDKGEPKGRVLD